MKSCYSVVFGLVLLSVCAAQSESQNINEAECTDCSTLSDSQVCPSLSAEALERCNCTSGSARAKRDLIFVIHPQTSAKCRCIIDSSKVVDFDFCPKDEDILGPGDEGYDDPIFQPIIPTRFNEFNGESFTEEDLEKENFKCQRKQQFKVACNTCWCNSKGDGAKSCTRIACHPKTYLTL